MFILGAVDIRLGLVAPCGTRGKFGFPGKAEIVHTTAVGVLRFANESFVMKYIKQCIVD